MRMAVAILAIRRQVRDLPGGCLFQRPSFLSHADPGRRPGSFGMKYLK